MQNPQYFLLAMGLSGLLGLAALLLRRDGRALLSKISVIAKVMPALFIVLLGFGIGILPRAMLTVIADNFRAIVFALFFAGTALYMGQQALRRLIDEEHFDAIRSGRRPNVLTVYFLTGVMVLGLPTGFVAVTGSFKAVVLMTVVALVLAFISDCAFGPDPEEDEADAAAAPKEGEDGAEQEAAASEEGTDEQAGPKEDALEDTAPSGEGAVEGAEESEDRKA